MNIYRYFQITDKKQFPNDRKSIKSKAKAKKQKGYYKNEDS